MKKHLILVMEITVFAVLVIYTVASALIVASAGGEAVGQAMLSALPKMIPLLVVALAITFLTAHVETDYLLRPMEKMAKEASFLKPVQAPFKELKPIADVLNHRNEEMSKKIAELSEEKDIVEKAQRSKNDFIANITHEMNTPLTAIRGYAELLSQGVLDEAQTRDAADILVKQSDRLSKLIARIINYNELDNDDLPSYPVDASAVLGELLEGLAPDIAKKSIDLIVEVEEGVEIKSRYERVSELLGNLLRNAIRYNRDGGKLIVSLKRTGKCARFSVTDTGVGIAEENLERVFERFFTVDKSHSGKGGGFGLGLAMVKKICRRAGWVVNVRSVLGEGTTFTVDFT